MLFERIESELDKKYRLISNIWKEPELRKSCGTGEFPTKKQLKNGEKNTCNNDAASSIWKKNIQNTVSNRILQ